MVNILLGLLIVAVIVVRQLMVRPVREDARIVLVLVPAVYGLAALSRSMLGHHVSAAVIAK